jgi:hypothetical protein
MNQRRIAEEQSSAVTPTFDPPSAVLEILSKLHFTASNFEQNHETGAAILWRLK